MGIAIRFSAFRQAHRRDCRPILTCLACHLKTQIDNGRVSLLDPYEGVLQQFSLLDKAEAEGAHLRVRVRLGRRGGDVFTLLPDARALEGVGWLDFGYLSPRWFSAHRPFLYHMAHMGLGQSFISWVRLLYTEICSAIMINGYTSDSFWPSQGVRQGCPLSALLYVISIEVLAANLRAHPDIVGLRPPSLSCSLPVMSRRWWLAPLPLSMLFLLYTVCSRKDLAPGSTLANARAFGLAPGVFKHVLHRLTSPGLSPRSRSWGFTLGKGIFQSQIGVLV